MTRKIPKLREKGWPKEEEPSLPPVLPEIEGTPANDAVLDKLVRERAFAALEAKLVSCYGSIPDEIKDEVAEMRRSLA